MYGCPLPVCSMWIAYPHRILQHDLSTHPEYKNVDEEYRIATIELETTELVLKDMRKYHDHLDKALLNFHSLKLAQINKIIHELWMLTYKGEDITRQVR
jgi:DNA repair protein RAD50